MADGGNSTVTEANSDKMAIRTSDKPDSIAQKLDKNNILAVPVSSRPILPSHNSSSVPSTPYAHARKLSDEYRTPSPMMRGPEAPSPRSSRSESESTVRSTGRAPLVGTGCIYETGMAFSRRRIPYSIGGDVLEPQHKVRKTLDPADQEKLSGDMRELYDRILPSADSDLRRSKFVAKLDKILNVKWPGKDTKVHVFGSSGNFLCSNDSDVDICITTNEQSIQNMCLLARTLAEEGMKRVVCVPHAKVPIVKIWDPDLQLACDMNVNNTLALENTRMIRTYVQIDPRVRLLAMVIKHWTKRRVLNDAALGGTLSSYTWICLIINFLQTRKPKPVLPVLQQRPHQCRRDADGNVSRFADDIESLRGFGQANKESIGELLFHFFRRYGHELDFEKNIISVRTGGLLSKKEKGWHLMQNNRLCVEEPFNNDRNLGNTADDISFRGVHLELRRAFELISQGKLSEACEEYEFPPQEEKPTFVRPAPQPRPVLSRSMSQQGRKSGNNMQANNSSRSNPGPHKFRNNSSRRASSAAAMNKMSFPPASSGRNAPTHSQPTADPLYGDQISNQLYQQYQMLHAQETHLRLQMHQMQQANIHAVATAQVPAQLLPIPVGASTYSQQGSFENGRKQAAIEQGPLSAPLRAMPGLYQPLHMLSPSSRSPQGNTPQSATNPPSPSIASSQLSNGETRRSMQRSIPSDNTSVVARSHSQPPIKSASRFAPRTMRPSPVLPMNPTMQGKGHPYKSLQHYQQQFLQAQRPGDSQPALDVSANQTPRSEALHMRPMIVDGSEDGQASRQYIGYYLDTAPQHYPTSDRDGLVPPPIPTYQDLANRARRASASPNLSRLRTQASRSPSPSYRHMIHDPVLGHAAVKATGSSSNLAGYNSNSTTSSVKSPELNASRRSGPVIVDGSGDATDYPMPPVPSFFSIGQSEVTSLSDDVACDTPSSTSIATSHDPPDNFALEPSAGYRLASSMPNILQFGEFPAQANLRNDRPSHADEKPQESKVTGIGPRPPKLEQSRGLGIDFNALDATNPRDTNTKTEEASCTNDESKQQPTDQEITATTVPLLSPVREVRTPSPTATRNSNLVSLKPSNASSGDHRRAYSLTTKEKASSTISQTVNTDKVNQGEQNTITSPNGPARQVIANGADITDTQHMTLPHNTPIEARLTNPKPKQPNTQTSEWQPVASKKHRKNRKANSVGSASIMQEHNERKGG